MRPQRNQPRPLPGEHKAQRPAPGERRPWIGGARGLRGAGLERARLVAGGQLSAAGASGRFSDQNAAADKIVEISGITLAGTDARNYTLGRSTAATRARIERRPIAGDITASAVRNSSGATLNLAPHASVNAASLQPDSCAHQPNTTVDAQLIGLYASTERPHGRTT